ncbi:hypothetical protein MMC13_001668 [Lambiella insularis]|nr:hypothetical protein [Lambiella insularis]
MQYPLSLVLFATLSPIAKSSSSIGDPHDTSNTKNYWYFKDWLLLFVIIAIAMVVGPLLLLALNTYAGPAWRRYRNSTNGECIQHTRGELMRAKKATETVDEQRHKGFWYQLSGKHGKKYKSPDYHPWFWKPPGQLLVPSDLPTGGCAGQKNHHQPLQRWFGKLRTALGRSGPVASDQDRDLEQGIVASMLPRGSKSQDNLIFGDRDFHSQLQDDPDLLAMSGALHASSAIDISTVRQRHVFETRPNIWNTGSDEIERATHEQLFDDAHGGEIVVSAPETSLPSQHHDNFVTAMLNYTGFIGNKRTRIVSSKAVVALGQHGSRFLDCPVPRHPLPSKPGPNRTSGLPQAPPNSEETISRASFDSKRILGRKLRRKPCFVLDPKRLGSDRMHLEYVKPQSTWLSSAPLLHRFENCARTEGRVSACESPDKSRTIHQSPVFTPLDDLSTYEAEGSIDYAISQRCSSTSTRAEMLKLSQYRTIWDGQTLSPGSAYLKLAQREQLPQRRLSLQDCMQTSLASSRLTPPMAKPRSATSSCIIHPITHRRVIDQGIYASLARTSESREEESRVPNPYVSAQGGGRGIVSSTKSSIRSLQLRTDEAKSFKADLCHYDSNFLPELQSSLARLQYELSPGFRSSPLKTWWRHSAGLPMVTANDTKMNVPSEKQSQQQKYGRIQRSCTGSRELATKTNSTFDTAAWILRQPPDGIGLEAGAQDFLYTGSLGKRKTLAEWQSKKPLRALKRRSSEESLPERPAKIIRRAVQLVKVRLRRGAKDNWVPTGFSLTPSIDGALSSMSSDVSGGGDSWNTTEGSEDGC